MLCEKVVQQIWKHYEKQLNSLSLDYEQLKENRDIISKLYLVDWRIYNGIVRSKVYTFIDVEFKWKKNMKNRKLKQKINNNHFLLRFHNTGFDVIFEQGTFSMLGASSYNFQNKGTYYLRLWSIEGQ